MANRILNNCPVCGGQMIITRLGCEECGTAVTGKFDHGLFSNLNDEEIRFVELFVVCRGNIKEVEKRLGVSYPTVRGKLDGVVSKLEKNLSLGDSETRSMRRKEIIESIKRGDISPEDGAMLIEEL
jgi:hypothetical protein